MNLIFVNIIDSYWGVDDVLGIYEQGRRHRYSGTFQTQLNIDEFEEKLTTVIMTEKGDGIDLEINSCGNTHYSATRCQDSYFYFLRCELLHKVDVVP